MSLDIHIAESREQALHGVPRLSIEEPIHDRLFFSKPDIQEQLPMMQRMEDFYKDFIFLNNELDTVRNEITSLRSQFSGDVTILKTLDDLDRTFAEAKSSGLNVYGFSD